MRYATKQSFAPTAGLDYRLPPNIMPERYSANMKNMRLENGVVRKDWGYSTYGTNNPIEGVPCHIDVYKEYDGSLRPLAFSTKYIYEYETASDRWNPVGPRSWVLDTGEAAWDAQANVTCDTSTDEKRGTKSASTAIAAAFGTGLASSNDLTAADISTATYIRFWIKSDIATSAGDIQLGVSEQVSGGEGATYARWNIPALVANTWTVVELDTSAPDNDDGGAYPGDLNAVVSVYLYVVTDLGAQTILIDDVRAFIRGLGDQDDGWDGTMHNNEYFATNGQNRILRKQQEGDFDHMAGITDFAKYIRSFKTRLVLANTNESSSPCPQRVRWSIAGALNYNSTDWSGTGSGFVDLIDTAGHINRIQQIGDMMIIYKEDAIYTMTWIGGTSIFRFDLVTAGLGLLGQRCVITRKGAQYFVGTDYNVYAFSGSKEPEVVGDPIASQIANLINPEQEDRSVLLYDDDADEMVIYIPVATDAQPSRGYRYSFKEQAWSETEREYICWGIHQEYTSKTFGTYGGTFGAAIETFGATTSKSSAKVYLVADSNGYIYKIDKSTVNLNGTVQECYFDTPDLTLTGQKDNANENVVDHISEDKRFMEFSVEARGNDMELYYSIDGGTTWVPMSGSGTHSLSTSWERYIGDLGYSTPKMRFRVYNNTLSSDIRFRWWMVKYIVSG